MTLGEQLAQYLASGLAALILLCSPFAFLIREEGWEPTPRPEPRPRELREAAGRFEVRLDGLEAMVECLLRRE